MEQQEVWRLFLVQYVLGTAVSVLAAVSVLLQEEPVLSVSLLVLNAGAAGGVDVVGVTAGAGSVQ